jgi:hypothetical protein
MRTKNDFVTEFEALSKAIAKTKDPSYGAPVMPFLTLFASLTAFEERMAFQEALEDMLASADADKRRRAVTICTGLVVFRDAI